MTNDYANLTMFLIYPGMTDFEEVEIITPADADGFAYVRPFGSDDEIKVHTDRLVDRETATARSHTRSFTRHTDWGSYSVTETSVTA